MAQKKLPAIQFYPGDWRKDVGVQSLSFHDRGVWFEMLMLMHESERRGILLLNGRAMAEEALGRLLGLDNQNLTKALTNLVEAGVASRHEDTGALMSRRMVRDEEIRSVRTECGKKGGNPGLVGHLDNQNSNQITTTGDKQNSTPSSSSSVSSSKLPPTPQPITFDQHMVATGVMSEIGARSMQLPFILAGIAEGEIARGCDGLDVKDRLIARWEEYRAAGPRMEWQYGSAEKFFASGFWDSPANWGWKQGQRPPPSRAAPDPLEEIRREREQALKEKERQDGDGS